MMKLWEFVYGCYKNGATFRIIWPDDEFIVINDVNDWDTFENALDIHGDNIIVGWDIDDDVIEVYIDDGRA